MLPRAGWGDLPVGPDNPLRTYPRWCKMLSESGGIRSGIPHRPAGKENFMTRIRRGLATAAAATALAAGLATAGTPAAGASAGPRSGPDIMRAPRPAGITASVDPRVCDDWGGG